MPALLDPTDADTVASLRSLRRIKRLSETEGADVWISHDPGAWAKLAQSSAFHE